MTAALESALIGAALAAVAAAYVLWLLFLAVMALQHAWPSLPGLVRALAVPAVVVAIVLDFAFNILATVPFADPRANGRSARGWADTRAPAAGEQQSRVGSARIYWTRSK